MPRPGTIIPKLPIAKILMAQGAKRVSEDAINEVVNYLIKYSEEISERALKLAIHSGRKTIQDVDIKLAVK